MKKGRILNVAIAVAVVAFLVLRADPEALWDALRDFDGRLALLTVLLNVPVALLAPLRSALVFNRLGHRVPAAVLIPTTVVGFVAGGLTPGAAGELLRAGPLRTRAGVPFEESMAVIVFERLLSLYLMVVLTAFLAALNLLPSTMVVAAAVATVVLCFAPALAATVLLPRLPPAERIAGTGLATSMLRQALQMASRLHLLIAEPLFLARWLLVTIAIFAVVALQYWLLCRALSDAISFHEAWLAFGVSTLAGVASLIPLGLGVLDSSLAAVLDRFGMTLEQGGIVALVARGTIMLPLAFIAFACYLYLQRAERPVPGATDQPRTIEP
jgi:uncharacterized protein (TIRG00374 family)